MITLAQFSRRLVLGVIATGLAVGLQAPPAAEGAPKNLVTNGSFSKGTTGWRVNEPSTTKLSVKKVKKNKAAFLQAKKAGATLVLNDDTNTVQSGEAGLEYTAYARLRSNRRKLSGELRVREVYGDQVISHSSSFYQSAKARWVKVKLTFTTTLQGAALDLNILVPDASTTRKVYVDSVSLKVTGTTSEAATPPPSNSVAGSPGSTTGGYVLSDGCVLNARGVGDCAPIVGAAVGSNTDPTSLENGYGKRLGVRRTYYQANQVDAAIRNATVDLATGRIPWISFKLPYNWSGMVAGKGDEWAKDIAVRISRLDGPVWVAFHHEPEKDEPDITKWTKMQERLGPIIRSNAPNAAFSVILTGWNQLYGPSEFRLASIWPNTTVDIAGFDIYCFYGTTNDGKLRLGEPSLKSDYFDQISAWAKKKGMAWGLAETGLSDRASSDNPHWIRETYAELKADGALAMSYFDTPLNSTESYEITTTRKASDFTDALKLSPSLAR